LVLRPISKTKKFSGTDVASGQREGLLFNWVWDFSIGSTLFDQPRSGKTLVNQDIIKMVQAGFSTDLITEMINTSKVNFDLSPNGLLALKEAGVPDEIIRAMVERNKKP
jgi:hypothetical protein